MSNIKEFRIEVVVPYDVMQSGDYGGGLDTEDIAFIAGFVVGPHAAEVEWFQGHSVRSESGGRYTRYHMVIEGREAYSWQALDRLVNTLAKTKHAEVLVAEARDVQWEDQIGQWEYIGSNGSWANAKAPEVIAVQPPMHNESRAERS